MTTEQKAEAQKEEEQPKKEGVQEPSEADKRVAGITSTLQKQIADADKAHKAETRQLKQEITNQTQALASLNAKVQSQALYGDDEQLQKTYQQMAEAQAALDAKGRELNDRIEAANQDIADKNRIADEALRGQTIAVLVTNYGIPEAELADMDNVVEMELKAAKWKIEHTTASTSRHEAGESMGAATSYKDMPKEDFEKVVERGKRGAFVPR